MIFLNWRRYFAVALILMMCFYLILFVGYDQGKMHIILFKIYNSDGNVSSTCIIPDYDPFDDSVKKYFRKYPAINCGTPQLPLTYLDNEGFLHVNESALKMSKIPRKLINNCTYQEIIRPPNDDWKFELGNAKLLLKKAKLNATSVVVKCYSKNKLIYESSHLQVLPLEPELDLRSKKALQVHGINVIIFCIDSMSRLNFIRQLPKTYKLITEHFDFDVPKGLTKVGDNSFPNMVVMLSGLADYNVDKSLGPFARNTSKRGTLDDLPFMWKNFSAKDYVTMCLEDSTGYSLLNYHTGGFKQPPTNYYTRPFWLSLEKQTGIVSKDKRCKGHVPKHQFFMKFLEQFINKMHQGQNAFFAFALLDNLSHNELNSVQVIDDELVEFLIRLHSSGVLENTFMLLHGDHGHRFDNIRKTTIGRVEESMPFLGIHLPESLKHLRENVRQNLNVLTSWHDVYETLMDVAMNNTEFQSKQVRYGYRGLSLFRPIPADRTCSEIGIPQKYCICSYEKELDVSEPRVLESARLLVDHVNNLLKPHAKLCATLTLDAVISSQLLIPYSNNNTNPSETQIRVLISAEPSGAMLEGLVVRNKTEGSSQVQGEVNRINAYGNQSACIDDVYITTKMYCLCKH